MIANAATDEVTSVPPDFEPAYQLGETPAPESLPIAVVVDFVNTSSGQYDRLIEAMGLFPRGVGIPGCLFHWARNMPDGLRIIEVWRSQDAFEFYLANEFLPVVSEVQLPEPAITTYEVHNYLTARAAVTDLDDESKAEGRTPGWMMGGPT
jgi:quinol monooxygenase YgiN